MKRKLSAAMIFAAVAMLAFVASAGAVDGTIEINQAKVLATFGSFPYFITSPGSYRLTGNLTVPASKNGIDVGQPNVTIDLNGFSITGAGGSAPIGIDAAGQSGVTVENGTVTGFGIGVELGNFGIVRNVHADKNGNGIDGGNDAVVEGCTANNTTSFSVSAYGINCAGGCAISGNTVNSYVNAIECNGPGCLISGNTVSNNVSGIFASDATTGYGGNVLKNTINVSGGTSMGNNVCTTGVTTSTC